MRFCEECGAQLEDGVKFCEECGAEVEELVIDEVPVEKTDIEETVEAENMVQPAVQKEKTVPKAESKPVKSGKPMKKGLLFGIIGAVLVVILAVVLIIVLGGEKEDDSGSQKEKDKQVEEDISEKDAEEKQDADDEENKDNPTGDSTVEEQEEKVSIFDVGFGGEFSGGTYAVETDDGFGMELYFSPMASYAFIHTADWKYSASFDLEQEICFDTEYTTYYSGVDEYGDDYTHELTFTVQKDGIWIYWYFYGYRANHFPIFDGFVSSDNITCTSSYTEYEWGLNAIHEAKVPLTDRDSKYILKQIDDGELLYIQFYSGFYEGNELAITNWMDDTQISIYNENYYGVSFEADAPIYYGEEFIYMFEEVGGPYEAYHQELEHTIQANGKKVYDTTKYDDYTEVRILVNEDGIDVYWCGHSKNGAEVYLDNLFEAECVERTIGIKNY